MFFGMTTEETWLERVNAWRASGRSAPRFCAGKGYTEGTLRYWASRLKKAAGGVDAERAGSDVRIARVVRAPVGQEAATMGSETAIVIEVGGARVGVRRGFDREALREVLSMLGGAR